MFPDAFQFLLALHLLFLSMLCYSFYYCVYVVIIFPIICFSPLCKHRKAGVGPDVWLTCTLRANLFFGT